MKCEFCMAQNVQVISFKSTSEFADSTFDVTKPIFLDYKQTHLLINFADRQDSLHARYAYRLVGFDNRWYENGALTGVNYTNLFGGNYELQVKNLNYPGKIASVTFHLDKALWQKPWFCL